MRNYSIWSLAWRNLLQQPIRSIFSMLTVAIGVGMVVGSSVAGSGMQSLIEVDEGMMEYMNILLEITFSIIGAIFMGGAGFLIFNAFAMSVTQRRQQIGMMRALGADRKQIRSQLLAESILIGGTGVMIGVGIGPVLGRAILSLMRYYGAGVGRGEASLFSIILGMVLGMSISVLSVLIPARRAAKISPLSAIRQEAANDVSSFSRKWAYIGTAIIGVLTVYLVFWPPGEWAGNHQPWDLILPSILFLPWLLGLALLIPGLIDLFRYLIQGILTQILGAPGRLISDNLGRDRRRVVLTLLTFAVGIGMMVGINGILVFTNDILLAAVVEKALQDQVWFIQPFDRTSGLAQMEMLGKSETSILKPEVQQDVYEIFQGRAGIGEAYNVFIPAIAAPVPGFPSLIVNVEMLMRTNAFTFVDGGWETAEPIMRSDCGVLLPSGVATNLGVGVGDEIRLNNSFAEVACTVAGIGSGGMLPVPYLGLPAREAFGVSDNPTTMTIWPYPDTDIRQLEDDLEALAERHGDNAWLSTPALELRGVLDVSDQLESMTYGMLGFALVSGALGMVNTTMMSVMQRKSELGTLRCIGATQKQTTQIVLGEAALTGLLGALLGLVSGLGLAVIYAISYGGLRFSIQELDLWASALKTVLAILPAGLWSLLLVPLLSTLTAWFPARYTLKDNPVNILRQNK